MSNDEKEDAKKALGFGLGVGLATGAFLAIGGLFKLAEAFQSAKNSS